MNEEKHQFTFSDTISGYASRFDWDTDTFILTTSDGREYQAKLTANTYAEMVRNLGEAFIDSTAQMKNMLDDGRYLFAYGVFYPEEDDLKFEAMHIVFLGRAANEYRFESQDWWIKQVKSLADFYLKAQFGDGPIDYKKYRTDLSLEGEQEGSIRQETATICGLVYGCA